MLQIKIKPEDKKTNELFYKTKEILNNQKLE